MIVDTSAVLAIVLGEPEAAAFASRIRRAETRLMSAASLLEAYMRVVGGGDPSLGDDLFALLRKLGVTIASVDEAQAQVAAAAFLAYGKGRHPAGLNYGDCFVYALAKQTGMPLLYKGRDFTRTDLEAAHTAQGE